jgi:hypothetical protein
MPITTPIEMAANSVRCICPGVTTRITRYATSAPVRTAILSDASLTVSTFYALSGSRTLLSSTAIFKGSFTYALYQSRIGFSSVTFSINEPADVPSGTAIRIDRLDYAQSGAVTLTVWTGTPGTAAAGSDYFAIVSQAVTIDRGQTSGFVTLDVLPDASPETDETLTLYMTIAAGPACFALGVSPAVANVTIPFNDGGVGTSFTANWAPSDLLSVAESGGSITATITRTGIAGSFSIAVTVAGVTATASADYSVAAASFTVSFAEVDVERTFAVTVLSDSLAEATETLTLTLGGMTRGTAAAQWIAPSPSVATLSILDSSPFTLSFAAPLLLSTS